MVVANRVVQGRREENDLIPRHPRFRPILHEVSPSKNNRRSPAAIASVNYNQSTPKHEPPIRVARSRIKSIDRLSGGGRPQSNNDAIDVCLANDRHASLFGPISGLPLVGLGSLAMQTSIKCRITQSLFIAPMSPIVPIMFFSTNLDLAFSAIPLYNSPPQNFSLEVDHVYRNKHSKRASRSPS
jgi:hypothetical protein